MTQPTHSLLEDRWVRLGARAWALAGLATLVAAGAWLLGKLLPALTPLILASVVTLVLRRPVAALEARGVSRWLGVVICYLASAVVVAIATLFVVPVVVREVSAFAEAFPRYYDAAYGLWLDVEREWVAIRLPEWVDEALVASRGAIVSWLTELSGSTARVVVGAGGRVFGFLAQAFLALALAFFLLRDLPALKAEVLALAGSRRDDSLTVLAREIVAVLEGFLKGQLMIAVIVGTITGVGLAALGVPYAAAIGLIAGVTNLIPYLGPVIGGIVAAISAAFVSPQLMLWTIVWVFVVQQTESVALQPRIMAHQARIHPAVVIVSLAIGARFFGLLGMLFAVPVAAVVTVLFTHFYSRHIGTDVRSVGGVLFPRRRVRRGSSEDATADAPDTDDNLRQDG